MNSILKKRIRGIAIKILLSISQSNFLENKKSAFAFENLISKITKIVKFHIKNRSHFATCSILSVMRSIRIKLLIDGTSSEFNAPIHVRLTNPDIYIYIYHHCDDFRSDDVSTWSIHYKSGIVL